MHRRSCIPLILGAFGAVILLGGIAVYCLVFDQSQSSRNRHIDRVLAEIHRGNYFAWGQVWMWMGRLTPAEEKELTQACGEYALTNHVLHDTGIVWPPEPTSTTFREWSAWVKGGLGVEDRTLAFDVIELPPSHDVHMSLHEALYRLPDSATPDPVALKSPPASRGQ